MKSHLAALSMLCAFSAWADEGSRLPRHAGFTTLVTTPLAIEGLSGDRNGNLYTTGRNAGAGVSCPVWRIALSSVTPVVVGFVPAPSPTGQCSPSGITFGPDGRLYFSEGATVYALAPDAANPPTATVYATGVLGTNGLAFDRRGTLWTGDGTQGNGRVWSIAPGGGVGVEVFRIQPMANSLGVGRSVLTLPPGTAQPLVANGVAFDREGKLLIADTARGAIWEVEFDRHGNLESRTGCDTTFTANTLCLSNVMVAHPLLDGADGIALDRAGNIWVDANERNAVVVVTNRGRVIEVFRNAPDATTGLRNGGPLETPTSPFLLGDVMCTANSDGNRRDNVPNTAGEISPAGPARGKISCLDQRLHVPGLPLPVRSSHH
ncbi:MAG: SMP-30/gluconolactonase/LRE family protein [Burkholderiaceae bacterium]